MENKKRTQILLINDMAGYGKVALSVMIPVLSHLKYETFNLPMLMYGKEASNRKQEIDRQHYTIPNQRPKDKHCGKI